MRDYYKAKDKQFKLIHETVSCQRKFYNTDWSLENKSNMYVTAKINRLVIEIKTNIRK